MAYRLEISDEAQKDLAKLDRVVLQAVRKRLKRLVETADEINHLSLTGQFAGLYKLCACMVSIVSSTIYNTTNN